MRRTGAATAAFATACCLVAAGGGPLDAQAPPTPTPVVRTGVLAQVKVPHAYYWREMYVPQATSGPGAPCWSPDGQEIAFAMHGSLWRQRVGTSAARQITDGPGYGHQPDWSPDGRTIVYSSYRDGALALQALDLETRRSTSLVADGAVNLEARFSPDGRRLAWVSTAYEGRFHIFVADVERAGADLRLQGATRITEDQDSGLPRYYYSRFDHFLSPSWSPDGREIILVSNRGRLMGSGGFWRMEARPGAPMRALHHEETTWKARPDWAKDGKRVAYASYHGRQWHQLWLLSAEGGDPLPLTYGEHDATSPRFSPDGRRLAYVSNEDGDTDIRILDLPGGKPRRMEPRERAYLSPVGRLNIAVTEGAAGTPARISVIAADGRGYAPDDAWRHGDESLVRGEQAFEHTYFHTAGRATVTVPAGRVVVEAWKGPEFAVARQEIDVAAGSEIPVRIALRRIADLPAEGLWGGDLHVHMNYGGAYRNTPAHLALQAKAEGLHLVENLVVNKEQRIPDISLPMGVDPVSGPGFVLAHGQEFHTSVWGHLGLLGLREYLLPDYAGYAGTALASLSPTNVDVSDRARALGGRVGYVHPFDTRPDPDDRKEPLAYALPVDVALGKNDYFEVMGFSDHHATSEVWYRLLNCGFRLPAGAGTDAFPNFASLRGPAGLLRVYAEAGKELTHDSFLGALTKGRTFVTNAPLLWFSVAGETPGGTVTLKAGQRVEARVRMVSAVPVDRVEIIGNGRVVATVPVQDGGTRAEAVVPLEAAESGWYVLRAWSTRPRLPVLDLYPFSSTSAVYVEVAGRPARNAADADWFLRWISRIEEAALVHTAWNTPDERERALAQITQARAEFERRRTP